MDPLTIYLFIFNCIINKFLYLKTIKERLNEIIQSFDINYIFLNCEIKSSKCVLSVNVNIFKLKDKVPFLNQNNLVYKTNCCIRQTKQLDNK